jgi:GNAT superfamily N-acetyltransferase
MIPVGVKATNGKIPPHYIKPVTKPRYGQQFIYVDTETKVVSEDDNAQYQSLWFGFALYVRYERKRGKPHTTEEWFKFTDTAAFWDWVVSKLRPKSVLTIFAHNLSFDCNVLKTDKELTARNFKLRKIAYASTLKYVEYSRDRYVIRMVDTFNFYPFKLDDIGKAVGIAKLEMPGPDDDIKLWYDYCKRDVEILRKAVENYRQFLADNDFGPMMLTNPSQALNTFLLRFNHHKILVHGDDKLYRIERLGYYGGRVDVLYRGRVEGPIYRLDINSAYPYVMSNTYVPVQPAYWGRGIGKRELEQLVSNYCVIAAVRIRTDKPYFIYRQKDRNIFPIGDYWTVLSTPELEFALKYAEILDVGPFVAYYRRVLFKDYVEKLYGLRLKFKAENNTVYELICKLLLNALYGKFGQKRSYWEFCEYTEPLPGLTEILYECGDNASLKHILINNTMYHKVRDEESGNSFPAISAHITSAARVLLLTYTERAGWENVYYMDTDSLHVNAEGYVRLSEYISQSELGKLKLEGVEERAVYYAPKDYEFGGSRKIKGISKQAVMISDNEFIDNQFANWLVAVASGSEGIVTIKKVRKQLSRTVLARVHTDTGPCPPYSILEPSPPAYLCELEFPAGISPYRSLRFRN